MNNRPDAPSPPPPSRRRPGWLIIALSLVVPVSLVFVLAACSRSGDDPAVSADELEALAANASDDEDPRPHDAVRLTESELGEFDINVGTAGPGRIQVYVELPGEVRPNADRLAHIVPRFSGIVTEVRKRIGDSVRKGEVLAVIESDESLAPYELTTLIDGTVIRKHITRGEAVSREDETFVIADLDSVWVDISVYQRDVTRVRVGQRAVISPAHGLPEFTGTISYVAPVVDEETRTATARIVLPNASGLWRPGMFVTVKVLVSETEVPVAVPRTALQTLRGQSVVFVETEEGFRPRTVSLGRAGRVEVEIVNGLEAGDRYVTRGGFTLKAELSKSAFSEGHAH